MLCDCQRLSVSLFLNKITRKYFQEMLIMGHRTDECWWCSTFWTDFQPLIFLRIKEDLDAHCSSSCYRVHTASPAAAYESLFNHLSVRQQNRIFLHITPSGGQVWCHKVLKNQINSLSQNQNSLHSAACKYYIILHMPSCTAAGSLGRSDWQTYFRE